MLSVATVNYFIWVSKSIRVTVKQNREKILIKTIAVPFEQLKSPSSVTRTYIGVSGTIKQLIH